MKKLDGQIVVITGGARGIGEGICKIFCNEGAIVFIWDVLEEGQKNS
jgi:3-oxoacyl-[acyl-carrier protein] reductase